MIVTVAKLFGNTEWQHLSWVSLPLHLQQTHIFHTALHCLFFSPQFWNCYFLSLSPKCLPQPPVLEHLCPCSSLVMQYIVKGLWKCIMHALHFTCKVVSRSSSCKMNPLYFSAVWHRQNIDNILYNTKGVKLDDNGSQGVRSCSQSVC